MPWRGRGLAGAVMPVAIAVMLSAAAGPARCDEPGAKTLGSSVLPPLPGPSKAAAAPQTGSAAPPPSLSPPSPPALSGATAAPEPSPSAAIPPAPEAAAEPAAAAEQLAAARQTAIEAARRVQQGERALAAIRHEIDLLGSDADARRRGLAESRAEQQRLLDTLLHLARNPARGSGSDRGFEDGNNNAPLIERLRAEALMRDADPALRAELRTLTSEIARLETLQKRIAAKKSEAAAAGEALAAERQGLADAVARRNALIREMAPPQGIDAALRVADTERDAKNLSELVKRAEAAEERSGKQRERGRTGRSRGKADMASPQDDPTRPGNLRSLSQESGLDEGGASSSDGQQGAGQQGAAPPHPPLVPPVAGAVIAPGIAPGIATGAAAGGATGGAAGDGREAEPGAEATKDGLSFDAVPGATVVAPFDGKIIYAGPFRDFGRVLIIRHDNRYYSVLAGLGRVDVKLGDWVLAGEPVGAMPQAPSLQPGAQAPEEDQSGPGRLLYYELRRDGRPVDPQPWLARVEGGHDERNGEQKVGQ